MDDGAEAGSLPQRSPAGCAISQVKPRENRKNGRVVACLATTHFPFGKQGGGSLKQEINCPELFRSHTVGCV